jgi:acetyl esterase/lipase
VVNHVAVGTDAESRPDFAASIYAGLAEQVEVPLDAPPLFIAYAVDDPLMNGAVDVVALFDAWRKAGRPVEFHAYERGGHGFGMRSRNSTSDDWIDALGKWMVLHDLLPRPQ